MMFFESYNRIKKNALKLTGISEMLNISEMSVSRSNAKIILFNEGHNIREHLLKVLIFKDCLNEGKHIRELNGFLKKLQRMRSKRNKPFKFEFYYYNLYQFLIEEKTLFLERDVKDLKRDYRSVQVRNLDLREIEEKLERIMSKISYNLSKDIMLDVKEFLSEEIELCKEVN